MLRIRYAVFFSLWFAGLSAQTEDIKVVSYNLMFYKSSSAPCTHSRTTSQRDNDLKTIVSYLEPDIFLVNELGSAPVNPLVIMADILNVNGISHYERAASSNNSSSSIVNMLFYNKDKLGMVGQDQISLDINTAPLIRVIDFYHLYVKDPALGSPNVDTVFLSVGLAHLKAGSGSSNEDARDRATAAVMDYIEDLSYDNILFAGDFNVYSASEAAFQNLVNYAPNPSISLNDPINQMGAWNNNSNFATVHTQSTHASSTGCFSGGGMDDRFDFILSSDAILNNSAGINYTNYRTVGQDGGSYNGNLSTNNNLSVPSSVASALYFFSDHLPVMMELEASVSGIGETEAELKSQSWTFNNPVKDRLHLRLEDKLIGSPLQISLYDSQGRCYWQGERKGLGQIEIPLPALRAGFYFIRLSDGPWSETRKVIVK